MQASFRKMWLGALVVSTVALGAAMAQTPVSGGKLSEAQVREELQKMSPKFREEELRNSNGRIGTVFFVELTRNGLRVPVQVQYQDRVLFIHAGLAKLKPANELSGEHLTRLLQMQVRTGPTYFTLANGSDGAYLRMSHRMDTTASVQRFHETLNEVMGDVSDSMELWMNLTQPQAK